MIDVIIDMVRDELDRYTTDEIGLNSRDKFEDMQDLDFLQLFINTMRNDEYKTLDDIRDNFNVDLVINFDYNNY